MGQEHEIKRTEMCRLQNVIRNTDIYWLYCQPFVELSQANLSDMQCKSCTSQSILSVQYKKYTHPSVIAVSRTSI